MTRTLALFILVFSLSLVAQAEEYLGKDFFGARSVANEIIERWSPDEYIYVGVGRSPVPVMAILEAQEHQVLHFPVSQISDWNSEVLTYHFEQYMTDDVIKSEKKLLFIDFMFNGGSFYDLVKHMTDYFVSDPLLENRFDYAVLARPGQYLQQDWLQSENLVDLDKHHFAGIWSESFAERMRYSEYEYMAYYSLPVFSYGSVEAYKRYGQGNQLPNPRYFELLKEVRAKMGLEGPSLIGDVKKVISYCSKLFNSKGVLN